MPSAVHLKKMARWGAYRLGLRPKFPIYKSSEFLDYVRRKSLGFVGKRVETLVVGSSHGDYGFDPSKFINSYNAALTSADQYTAFWVYQNVRMQTPFLRNVILFYSVFSPGYSLLETREKYRAVAYRHFFDINYENPALISHSREQIIRRACDSMQQALPSAYRGYDIKRNYMINASGEGRAKTHLRENVRQPNQIKWISRLLQDACERGSKVIIVIPPFRSDYIKGLPDKTFLFRHLSQLTPSQFDLIDFYGSPLFDDDDMGDPDHLTGIGAAKMTRHLADVVRGERP